MLEATQVGSTANSRTRRGRARRRGGLAGAATAALLGSLPVGCREDPDPPALPCGLALEGCPERMHCDRVALPPRCVCDDAYTGTDCHDCALGYRRSGSRCSPEALSCRDDPCGARGDCISSSDGDRCECEEAYAGNRCASCADGFQDNDNNGVCREACGVAPLACIGRRVCSDASGVARCACPNGYTGETCSDCEVGYRRLPGAPECIPTCESEQVSCGEQGTCVDGPTGAECVCLPGYAGESCEACATTTHSRNEAGDCFAPIPEETAYLTVISVEENHYLAALSSWAYELLPIVALEREVDALAYDDHHGVLYGISNNEIVSIDVTTGQLDTILASDSAVVRALAFDSSRELLYVASDSELFSIDPLFPTGPSLAARGATAMAYDAERDRLLLLDENVANAASFRRAEWDPATGEFSELDPFGLEAAPLGLALAIDPTSGVHHLLVSHQGSATDALTRHCRAAARALGVDADASTPLGEFGDAVLPGESRDLTYDGADPPLLLYGSDGDMADAAATLTVATGHPDAVVCIVTREQALEVVVRSEARLRLLIVSSEDGSITVRVEDGFAPTVMSPQPIRTHHESGPEPTVSAPGDIHVDYDAAGWAALHLRPFSSTTSPRAVAELGPIHWQTGATSLAPLAANDAEVLTALTAYGPGD